VKIEQNELPELHNGDSVENLGTTMEEKFTQPPARYNQSSLLAKMEQEQIGTKATRADIIATLFKRNYVSAMRGGIEVTDLGLAVIESMKEHAPAIISTELTRQMEEKLDKVEQGTLDSASAIENAVDMLIDSLSTLMEKKNEVGSSIGDAAQSVLTQTATIGPCPVCGKGQLRILRSRASKKRFVGCSNYSEGGCKATSPLPQRGGIRVTGKVCQQCSWPIVGVVFARRAKQWRICINSKCPSKKSRSTEKD
jgi:DNA topoisomerase-1